VYAIGIEFPGKRWIVIDDEGHTSVVACVSQAPACVAQGIDVHRLVAQLQAGRECQQWRGARKQPCRVGIVGRDQVKAAFQWVRRHRASAGRRRVGQSMPTPPLSPR
jgi:hypothetical protein